MKKRYIPFVGLVAVFIGHSRALQAHSRAVEYYCGKDHSNEAYQATVDAFDATWEPFNDYPIALASTLAGCALIWFALNAVPALLR